ncbi:MAG: hypothetical protein M0011_02485 [Elusimicrobia bacterium]|nr:hypothetical protein [Elusimicrobiota bacterium]
MDPAIGIGELAGTAAAGKAGGLLSGMTAGSMIAALFFSLVGLVYLKQGRASADVPKIACGVGLLCYTLFVSGTLYTVLVGTALAALPFLLDRF